MEPSASPAGWYREFEPHPALRDRVRALFAFGPGRPPAPSRRVSFEAPVDSSERSPSFADASASIVFLLPSRCDSQGSWREHAGGAETIVIGPMGRARSVAGDDLPAMVGAYFLPGRIPWLARIPAADLADRVVTLQDLWGSVAGVLQDHMSELNPADQIGLLENQLRQKVTRPERPADSAVKLDALLAMIVARHGLVRIEDLASAAGVSRQHLARLFRERIGVSPKLFCRLARFRSVLRWSRRGDVNWARAAALSGYADQSHLIADFREFSGFTPERLATGTMFHPFIGSQRGE